MLSGISLLSLFTAGFRNNLKYMVAGLILESGYILFDRKFLRNYLSNKNLSEGCTARGRGICLTAPLAREVCASTHFFIITLT